MCKPYCGSTRNCRFDNKADFSVLSALEIIKDKFKEFIDYIRHRMRINNNGGIVERANHFIESKSLSNQDNILQYEGLHDGNLMTE